MLDIDDAVSFGIAERMLPDGIVDRSDRNIPAGFRARETYRVVSPTRTTEGECGRDCGVRSRGRGHRRQASGRSRRLSFPE